MTTGRSGGTGRHWASGRPRCWRPCWPMRRRCGWRRTRAPGGRTLVDAGIEALGGIEAGRRIAEMCMGGFGRVAVEGGSRVPGRTVPRPRELVAAGAGLPRQPVCRLEPEQRRGRRGLAGHGLGPGPGARGQGALVRGAGLPRPPRAAPASCWRPTGRRRTALVREVADRLRPARADAHLHPDADHQPRRHGADRRARARGGAAQGARAGLPAGPTSSTAWASCRCRRRRRTSSPPWAGPTTPCCSAARPSCSCTARRRPRATSPSACRAPPRATHGRPFAELFEAAGYDFYKVDPHAVQPGQGHRHRPRDRPQLHRRRPRPPTCWRARSGWPEPACDQ